MTPEEQRQYIRGLIAYYDDRGADWLDIVGYLTAVFTGRWPVVKRRRKSGN